jgi:raffinose/stachyose/melibiose transport system permease protein
LSLDSLQRAWDIGGFATAIPNSLIVATSVTVISIVVSVLAGYAFGALRVPYASPLFYVFLIGLVVPLEAYVIPLYFEMRALSLLDTLPGLIIPLTAQMLPFGIFWMRANFRAMPPGLIDAAEVDGAGTWQTLRYVLLPISRPALSGLAVLLFLFAWNDLLLAVFMISSNDLRTAPLQLGIFVGLRSTDTAALAAAALIVSIPVLIVYVAFQRRLIDGLMAGAVKE